MNLENFKYSDWETYWVGNWSILSFSYWGNGVYAKLPFSKYVDRLVNDFKFFVVL